MSEITVVASRHADHPQIIAADSEENPFRLNPRLKRQQAHAMDAQKGNNVPLPEHVFPVVFLGRPIGTIPSRVHAETLVPSVRTMRSVDVLPTRRTQAVISMYE